MFEEDNYELATIVRFPTPGTYEHLNDRFDETNIQDLLKDYKRENISVHKDGVFITYREKNFGSMLFVLYVSKNLKKLNFAEEVKKIKDKFDDMA